MAQEPRGARYTVRKALRRFGISTRAVVAVVGICVMLGAAGVFWLSTQEIGAVRIERGQQGQDQGGVMEQREGESEDAGQSGGKAEDEKNQGRDANGTHATPTTIVVHVDGAVRNPGVYAIAGDAPRAMDAVEQAGGLDDDANTDSVNLASVISDGEKVHIPRMGEETPVTMESAQTAGQQSDTLPNASDPAGLVNINTADANELKSLSGVGDATAAAIIEDREAQGPFASPEDLMRVSGIGEKKFAKIRNHICV